MTALLVVAMTAPVAAEPASGSPDAAAKTSALVPPAVGAVELTLAAGVLSHETSYGRNSAAWLLGASAGWMPTRWAELQVLADVSSRRERRGESLGIRNTDLFVGLAPAFSLWFESLRFFAELGGGTMIRSVAYEQQDLSGAVRVAPALYAGAGFGLVLFGHLGFTVRGAARGYEDRLDGLITLDLSWFIGS